MSESLGLAGFPIGQADVSSHLSNGQWWLNVFMASGNGSGSGNFGQVQNSFVQGKVKCKLPKAQARFLFLVEPWV